MTQRNVGQVCFPLKYQILCFVLLCCRRAEKYATNPFFGLGHLKTKTNRCVSHVTLTYFQYLFTKCLVNNTVLSDFQYCIQLMLS